MRRGALLLLLASCAPAPRVDPALQPRVEEVVRQHRAKGKFRELAIGFRRGGEIGFVGNPDAVFEIGSVTKVFTAILLADMVRTGEVKLEDPVSKFVKVRNPDLEEMTLVRLATHTSGLPRLPDNLVIRDPENPYAAYTVAELERFLSKCDVGEPKCEYSNVGMGLLGHILAGARYEEIVVSRICEPLGLKRTRVKIDGIVPGFHADGRPAGGWELPTLAGAGALRSTARDMLAFLAANLGGAPEPLRGVMESTHAPRVKAGGRMEVGLGWHILPLGERRAVWHNGGTGGYRSMICFVRETRTAVVVLGNNESSVDELAFDILKALN